MFSLYNKPIRSEPFSGRAFFVGDILISHLPFSFTHVSFSLA